MGLGWSPQPRLPVRVRPLSHALMTTAPHAPAPASAGPPRVAVLGASGAVGRELLLLLEQRNFSLDSLTLLASPRSAGNRLTFRGESLMVEAVSEKGLAGADLVLASAGGSVSRQWAPVIGAHGALLIDNSSAFRMDPQVPLVVPEVNLPAARRHRGIVANPNCTTILLLLALAPLQRLAPLRRVVVSTYQSASGAGAQAMAELESTSRDVLQGRPPRNHVLPYPLAFNLFLHNSPLAENGYCEEELKMLRESRKILDQPDLRLSATCVRVPVLRAHAEAVNIEFDRPVPVDEARRVLAEAPGVTLVDDRANNRFPMPGDVTGKDAVAVGRIRRDLSHPNGLELWLCGDQIRKGAALNAVQIAEAMVDRGWLKPPSPRQLDQDAPALQP